MDVIPVIDLKGGTVVHARMGERDRYRPIETPLARGSDPLDVVTGLMSLHPFSTLYVADLDAITGSGDNRTALQRLTRAFPALTLWVDGGIADFEAAADWLQQGLGHLVLGSETQRDATLAQQLADNRRVVLSLDFRGDDFQGPPDLLAQAEHWPQRVIAMTRRPRPRPPCGGQSGGRHARGLCRRRRARRRRPARIGAGRHRRCTGCFRPARRPHHGRRSAAGERQRLTCSCCSFSAGSG
jgi:uncharacterized protein related to proFAR isomerase